MKPFRLNMIKLRQNKKKRIDVWQAYRMYRANRPVTSTGRLY